MEEETRQQHLMFRQKLEYGIVMYSAFLHISLSCFTNPSFTISHHPPCNTGVNDFAFYGGILVQKETRQQHLMFRQKLEYGIVMYSAFLHISLFSFTNPLLHCPYQKDSRTLKHSLFIRKNHLLPPYI